MTDEVRIEYVKASTLERWPRNPKEHDLPEIKSSLARFGFVQPIALDERTKRIVAGHGRLEASLELKAEGAPPPKRVRVVAGEWFLPVLRGVEFEAESEAEAYLLADNNLTMARGWDLAELAEMLPDLDLVGTGWTSDDVDRMVAEAAAIRPDDDDFEGERPNDVPADDPDHRVKKGGAKILVGRYRIKLTRERYDTWLDGLRQAVGLEPAAIEAEILKRLGL